MRWFEDPRRLCGLMLLAVLAFAGCGKKQVSLLEVSGTLTLDGEPLPEVHVSFMPDPEKDNAWLPSVAITDAAGRFQLKYTGKGEPAGAAAGWHRVVLSDYKSLNARDEAVPYRFGLAFCEPYTTPIKVEVTEGTRNFDFELSGFEVEPPPESEPLDFETPSDDSVDASQ